MSALAVTALVVMPTQMSPCLTIRAKSLGPPKSRFRLALRTVTSTLPPNMAGSRGRMTRIRVTYLPGPAIALTLWPDPVQS